MSDKEIHTDIDTSPKSSDTQEQRTQKTVLFINEVVKQIRSLKKHYPNMDIHVDTHGGIRTDQEAPLPASDGRHHNPGKKYSQH